MSIWELSTPFALGLLGSVHCMQMCGPIVLGYTLPMAGQAPRQQWLAHVAYNTGRILTYALLGAIAGMLGGTVGMIGRIAGIANAAAIVSGILLIVTGLVLARWVRWRRGGRAIARPRFSAGLSRGAARWLQRPGVGSKLMLGLTLGWLPCGLVYAALLQSAASAHPLRGAATMLAFGLGTAPALVGIAACSTTLNRWLGRWSTQIAAAGVVVLGLVLVWRGMAGVGIPGSTHVHPH